MNKIAPSVTTIDKHGYKKLKNCFTDGEITYLKQILALDEREKAGEYIRKSQRVQQYISDVLGPDYVFQDDYVFVINNTRIGACHRDDNGSFITGGKYATYTIIFFFEDMDTGCLDVIHGSHVDPYTKSVNVTDMSQHVICKPGDAILFDSDLVHSGTKNKNQNTLRVQLKIKHVDDDVIVDKLVNYNKKLTKKSTTDSTMGKLNGFLTCQFPVLSDLFRFVPPDNPGFKVFNYLAYGHSDYFVGY
jgi:ectoine hydroxylase-related dioxygenase (phytanoyl-CoA dioxygenase family)